MKVLIANRGEIAVRVIRACRELGLGTVAVYSDCDRAALHVRLADEAHHIGPSPAAESYLRIDRIVDVAKRTGATLVHPGYGFLAENEDFAQACRDAGLTFVGPTPAGDARDGQQDGGAAAAVRAGVPVVPGTETPFEEDAPDAAIVAAAERIGYPLVVKAVAGGGGKGMRTVATAADLPAAVRTARSEAKSAFGDAAVYLERRLIGPRHIEIQMLGDEHGTVLPFVERECSIQRRHQKVVEESPSIALDPATRREMAECAARVARAVGYTNAGTIEFLLDRDGSFYFLEMNTRLQVEHPVTEHGDRDRPRALAAAHRDGRAADDFARAGADAARARDRVPHLRRGSGPRLHAGARPRAGAVGAVGGPASATIAASRPASRSRSSTTR